ncbi:MAG: hypothetical protein LBQ33_05800 [Oscillospiraceae bacterium]|nr:hypothetical protein [Oscillospiraceae bacterium]
MKESLQLLKRFTLLCLLLLCVTALLCGGMLVNQNTRRLALGSEGRQVALRSDKTTTTLFVTDSNRNEWRLPAPAGQYLRLAPAPFGSLVQLAQAAYQAAELTAEQLGLIPLD